MKSMTPKHKKALILSTVIFLTGFAVTAVYTFGLVSEREAALALAERRARATTMLLERDRSRHPDQGWNIGRPDGTGTRTAS